MSEEPINGNNIIWETPKSIKINHILCPECGYEMSEPSVAALGDPRWPYLFICYDDDVIFKRV